MNIQFYLERLNSSKEFKKFKEENKNNFLCAGLFLIDKIKDNLEINFDYYLPLRGEIFSFSLGEEIKKNSVEIFDKRIPEKINEDIDFNFNEIEKIIKKKFQEENVNNKIQRIILSLQNLDLKSYLIGTIFISGLGMIGIKIDLEKNISLNSKKRVFLI